MSTQLKRLEGCTHTMPFVPDQPVAMAAPWETCNCCGNVFFYVDSFWAGVRDGVTKSGGRSHIPNLCVPCGGGYREIGRWRVVEQK